MTEKHRPGNGSIFGLVSKEGLVVPDSPVTLFDMRAGDTGPRRLRRQQTNQDGAFAFNNLNPAYGDYGVMATDEEESEPKNALIQDRVLPILGHSQGEWTYNWLLTAMRDAGYMGVMYPTLDMHDEAPSEHHKPYAGDNFVDTVSVANLNFLDSGTDVAPIARFGEFPGAPDAGLMQIAGGWVVSGTNAFMLPASSSDFQLTIEATIDFASVDPVTDGFPTITLQWARFHMNTVNAAHYAPAHWLTGARHVGNASNYERNNESLLSLHYNPTTRKLQGYVHVARPESVHIPRLSNIHSSFATLVCECDVPVGKGLSHIAFVYRAAGRSDLLIDGVVEDQNFTSPIVRTAAQIRNQLWRYALIVGGHNNSNENANPVELKWLLPPATFHCGPVAVYGRALSIGDVEAHYEYLFQPKIPVATGYPLAVINLAPSYYWRGDDVDAQTEGAKQFMRGDPQGTLLRLAGTVESQQPGPTQYLTALRFATDDVFFERTHGNSVLPLSPSQVSFTGWLKFERDGEVLTEREDILTVCSFLPYNSHNFVPTYGAAPKHIRVSRNTDGKLQISHHINAILRTYVFANYTPPVDEWIFVAIVTNTAMGTDAETRLYVGTPSTAPVLEDIDTEVHNGYFTSSSLAIVKMGDLPPSGWSSSSLMDFTYPVFTRSDENVFSFFTPLRLGGGFQGSLCEVAVYHRTLTPAMIAEIWTAKDDV